MMRFFSRHRRHRRSRVGVGLAVVALCLRLAVPAWAPAPAATPSGADLAALFGEHALCIAAAHGEAPPDPGNGKKAPARGHDGAACCLFHASLGFALPPAPPLATPATPGGRAVPFALTAGLAPRFPPGAARARAPPPQA